MVFMLMFDAGSKDCWVHTLSGPMMRLMVSGAGASTVSNRPHQVAVGPPAAVSWLTTVSKSLKP